MGPAILYTAPYGTTEPAYTAITSDPAAPWTDVGGTADGTSVLLEVQQTLTDIMVEQLVDPVGARVSKRVIQVTAALEEATLGEPEPGAEPDVNDQRRLRVLGAGPADHADVAAADVHGDHHRRVRADDGDDRGVMPPAG